MKNSFNYKGYNVKLNRNIVGGIYHFYIYDKKGKEIENMDTKFLNVWIDDGLDKPKQVIKDIKKCIRNIV